MTESMIRLLLQLCEAGDPAILWGRQTKPYPGGELDRLLARGILIEEAPAVGWDVCASCECDLDVRPVQTVGGRLLAACPLDRMNDAVLDSEDVRTFSINTAALVREIAAASGFTGDPSMIAPGVWHVGLTYSKRVLFLALSRSAVMQSGLLATLRSIAKSSPISLLTPPIPAAEQDQFASAGVHSTAIVDVLAPSDGKFSFALSVTDLTPTATLDPTLILIKPRQSIMLKGHEMTLPPRSFDLLWLLSEVIAGGGGVVTRRQIEQHLWGSQIVSKTAAADAIRDLRQQLAAAPGYSREAEFIETRHRKGYVLALSADAIQLVV